jgi:uncharacterized protein YhdP
VIDTSPLAELTRGALRDWRGDGALRVRLGLDMPLGGRLLPGQARVDVQADVEGARLQFVNAGLEVEALHGGIDYALERGLSGEGLRATLWGRPLSARIAPGAEGAAGFTVEVEGSAAVPDLERWLRLSGAGMLEGVAPFRLRIEQQGRGVVSRIDSDLAGVRSTLPAPLAKEADTPLPLSLAWWSVPEGTLARAGLGELARAALLRDAAGALHGEFVVGAGAEPEPGGSGARLRGEIEAADAGQWVAAVPRILRANARPGGSAGAGFRVEGLRAASATLWSATLHGLRLDSRRAQDDFVLDFAADAAAGSLRMPATTAEPLALALTRLDLQPFLPATARTETETETETAAATETGAAQPAPVPGAGWEQLKGVDLPIIAVEADQVRLGARSLGHWRFSLASDGEALAMTGVRATLPGATIGPLADGSEAWLRLGWPAGVAETGLAARVVLDDVGEFFDNWGQPRVLEARSGTADFALRWPGGPTDFGVAAANGTMDLRFRDGRLLRGGGNNPLMRAIGLLRFDELLRRMQFDFKDFYQKGLAFDRFSAPIVFADGTARTGPGVDLQGPTARVRLEGRSDLRAGQIDANLTVTLPIGSNLPWIAALAGGLPVAAGVYVASQLFEDQIGKLSSAVYKVSGPLDDPKVEFQQVFDVDEHAEPDGESPAAAPPVAPVPQPQPAEPAQSQEAVPPPQAPDPQPGGDT